MRNDNQNLTDNPISNNWIHALNTITTDIISFSEFRAWISNG